LAAVVTAGALIAGCGGRVDSSTGLGATPQDSESDSTSTYRSGSTSTYRTVPSGSTASYYSYTTVSPYVTSTSYVSTYTYPIGSYGTTTYSFSTAYTTTTAYYNSCSLQAFPPVTQICPDGSIAASQIVQQGNYCVLELSCPVTPTPVPTGCTQGAVCPPGSGCGSAGGGPNACTTTCNCDATGHMQCSTQCPVPPQPVCGPGYACNGLGMQCKNATGPSIDGCVLYCTCESNGEYVCNSCGAPVPATGCSQWAQCQAGQFCQDTSFDAGADSGATECCQCGADGVYHCTAGACAVPTP
jgi:hypothetical protein